MKKNTRKRKVEQDDNDILSAEFLFDEEIENEEVEFKQVKGYHIVDDSLIGDGILAGDYLECEHDFQLSEITPRHVCVVQIISTGKTFTKHVHFNKRGKVTLKASNPAFEDFVCRRDEIKILGVVVRAVTIKELQS
ncbi:MAG TPA: S24 family peptidase [Pyrinomonadaceae bacterium]|jgi:SOS-response transcriptional repressor LexA